jgi:hypothetical protein
MRALVSKRFKIFSCAKHDPQDAAHDQRPWARELYLWHRTSNIFTLKAAAQEELAWKMPRSHHDGPLLPSVAAFVAGSVMSPVNPNSPEK